MREPKIVILGSGGVGKSAITLQFCHSIYVEKYDPTIEDSYKKVLTVDGETIQIEIVDTAGLEQFMSMHSLIIKSGDAFALVFSLTSIDSVNELSSIRQQIVRIKDSQGFAEKDIPICLVGNKCDLPAQRQVPREVAISLSQLWLDIPYYESSARKRINVDEIFEDLIRQLIRRDAISGTSPTSSKRPKRKRCVII